MKSEKAIVDGSGYGDLKREIHQMLKYGCKNFEQKSLKLRKYNLTDFENSVLIMATSELLTRSRAFTYIEVNLLT